MPTYEYRCDACGHELEEFQSMSAKPLRKCPKCGRNKLTRLIGIGAGIIFKGSGFYETDYRSEGYKKDAKAEKDAAKPKTESKADSKTAGDTQPAASDTGSKKPSAPDKPAKKSKPKTPKSD